MRTYLIHQLKDGTPVGIFSPEGEHVYFSQHRMHERDGLAAVKARGSDPTWEEWAEQLASQWPTRAGQWDLFESENTDLLEVLLEVRDSMEMA